MQKSLTTRPSPSIIWMTISLISCLFFLYISCRNKNKCIFFFLLLLYKKQHSNYNNLYSAFYFFWLLLVAHGICFLASQFPDQGLNPCPLQQKRQVLTPGLPGNSLLFLLNSIYWKSFHRRSEIPSSFFFTATCYSIE